MKTKTLLATLSLTLGAGLLPLAAAPVPTDTLNRTVLQIPEPKIKPITYWMRAMQKHRPGFR